MFAGDISSGDLDREKCQVTVGKSSSKMANRTINGVEHMELDFSVWKGKCNDF